MNEDIKLYTNLINLKKQLQNQNYDHSDNTIPIICSDDSIKLLVKYKPTKLEDLSNICGIGESFIKNYGELFIEKIKKFISSDNNIEISNEEKQLLKMLENRLININKQNKLLYNGKINKNANIDVYKLINNIEELESFIINQNEGSFNLLNIMDLDDNNFKRIMTLIRQVNKIITESGNNELYIAYPFVQGKFENEDFPVKAPLLLFPVKIIREINNIILQNDNTRDILYNTTLILANNKFKGKNTILPDSAINDFNSEKYIENMLKFYEENELLIKYNPSQIEQFLENRITDFPNYKN